MGFCRAASAALLASMLLCVLPAQAQNPPQAPAVDDATRSMARSLGEAGIELFRSGDHAGALAQFDRAEALVRMPTLSVRAARCLEKLGRLVEAAERYLVTTALTIDASLPPSYQEAQRKAQAEAAAERAALLPRIPTLVLVAGAAPLDSLTLDGKPLSFAALGVKRPLDPGRHVVRARRGAADVTREVSVDEGDAAELNIGDLPVPSVEPSSRSGPTTRPPTTVPTGETPRPNAALRTVSWVAVAVGATVTGLGLGAMGVALSKQPGLDKLCPEGVCKTDTLGDRGQQEYNDYHTARTLAITGISSGVLLAAGGAAALLLTIRSGAPDRKVSLTVRPGFGGVTVSGAL